MPAMHFSSVLLPEPLRPTTPKNSPAATLNETSRSAWKESYCVRRRGWSTLSLSVWTRSCGRWKLFESSCTRIAGEASVGAGDTAGTMSDRYDMQRVGHCGKQL